MIDILESDRIYNPKTKEYFREVLSDYANGNYRSAVVMLYSVTVSDLLLKLRELVEMYDDEGAQKILKEVEKKRSNNDLFTKTEWEKDIVHRIQTETNLIEVDTAASLEHLRNCRNLSAHPALNEQYELIMPTKETTIALIRSILTGILIKPPIFISKTINMFLNDLEEKKVYYEGKREELQSFLKRKYFVHMTTAMKIQMFQSLWKICFILSDDENCKNNRGINRKAMEFLAEEIDNLDEIVKSDNRFSKTSPDKDCVIQLCVFLSKFPRIFAVLSEDTHLQIDNIAKSDATVVLLSWFVCKSKKEHIVKLIRERKFSSVSKETIEYVAEQYSQSGELKSFIDYLIEYYGNSTSYDEANERFENAIEPYLKNMNRDQFVNLIEVTDNNDQIYNRRAGYGANNIIVEAAQDVLEKDFDFSPYQRFRFNREKYMGEKNSIVDEEESLPFFD